MVPVHLFVSRGYVKHMVRTAGGQKMGILWRMSRPRYCQGRYIFGRTPTPHSHIGDCTNRNTTITADGQGCHLLPSTLVTLQSTVIFVGFCIFGTTLMYEVTALASRVFHPSDGQLKCQSKPKSTRNRIIWPIIVPSPSRF